MIIILAFIKKENAKPIYINPGKFFCSFYFNLEIPLINITLKLDLEKKAMLSMGCL
jgi:hypothetical protein